MKNSVFILFFFFQSIAYCQTKIDDNLSIRFPGEVEITEENTKGFKTKTFFHNTPGDAFFAMKLEGLSEKLPVPKDQSELTRYYQDFSRETITKLKDKGIGTKSEKLISFKDYFGYRYELLDNSTKETNGECLVLLIDRVAYLFIYIKINSYSAERKDVFFESINVRADLPQFADKFDYSAAALNVLPIIIIVGVGTYIKRKRKMQADV